VVTGTYEENKFVKSLRTENEEIEKGEALDGVIQKRASLKP
jgi:hypothetical protein